MSLEEATVADSMAGGQETATADLGSNDTSNRYEGFIDLDNPEPEEANQVEEPDTAETGEEPAEGAETTDDDQTEPDPWEGYEEIEVDGKVLKIPSEAKDYLLRQADYTRKTQEVAARAKELDTREEQIKQQAQISEHERDAHIALAQVGSQLKQFEAIDWAAEKAKCQDDPIALGELNARWMEYRELRDLQQQGQEYLSKAASQRTEMAKQETAKRLAATKAFAEKNIKGWTPALDNQITQWAAERGFTRDMLMAAYTPEVYEMVHDAYQWNQSLKRQKTAKPSTPKTPIAPTNTVAARGNAVVQKDPAEMSEAEFVAHREAQLARRKQ